jgi:tetratricopeptide (TPR) repeat protein
MKAEHRKELKTNVLAARLGQIFEGVRHKPSSTTIVVAVFVLVAVAVGLAWWFFSTRSSAARAMQWVKVDQAADVDDLNADIKDDAGSQPGRAARFKKARYLLSQGQAHLYTKGLRKEALSQLEEAADLYEGLAKDVKDLPVLHVEALTGAAASQEMCGKFDDAIRLYREAAQKYGSSDAGKQAAEKLALLEKDLDSVRQLQERLARQAESS